MKKTMFYAALAVVLASCSSEQVSNPLVKGDVKLELIGNVGGVTVTKAAVPLTATTVGVYAVSTTQLLLTDALTEKNHLYSVDNLGAFSSLDYIQLVKSAPYNAIAYAPYKSVITNPNAVEFAHGDDILYAPSTTVALVAGPPVTASVVLPFTHKMAQVKFKLTAGDGLTAAELVDAKVTVTGFYAKCSMDLANGTLVAGSDKTAVIETEQHSGVDLATTAIVPGTVALNFLINVKGVNYEVLNSSQTFSAGKRTELILNLKKNDTTLTVTSGTVVDWEAAAVVTPIDVPNK